MGGMAEIFRARLATDGFEKRVCIKRILPHFLEDEEFVTMFRDEARTAARLQHANCVHVFDFGEVLGTLYLAMELVDGCDLRRILDAGRKKRLFLEVGEAVQIAIDMCRGLHHAHTLTENGRPLSVVHRDVSPHNVLVSRAGEVKVTDFGIARAAERSTHTSTGIVKGKVAYMAPEQAQGLDFDHRLDQFATGVVLWEMLTGTRLFSAESDAATLRRILACHVAPPSTLRSAIPVALDAVLLRALSPKPEDRYADMREFELALSRFLFSGAIDPSTADVRNIFPRMMQDAPASVRKTQRMSSDDVDVAEVRKEVPPPNVKSKLVTVVLTPPEGRAPQNTERPNADQVDVSLVFTSSDKGRAASGPAVNGGSISPDAQTVLGAGHVDLAANASAVSSVGSSAGGSVGSSVGRSVGAEWHTSVAPAGAPSTRAVTESIPALSSVPPRSDSHGLAVSSSDATPATRTMPQTREGNPAEGAVSLVTSPAVPSSSSAAMPSEPGNVRAAKGRTKTAAALAMGLTVVGASAWFSFAGRETPATRTDSHAASPDSVVAERTRPPSSRGSGTARSSAAQGTPSESSAIDSAVDSAGDSAGDSVRDSGFAPHLPPAPVESSRDAAKALRPTDDRSAFGTAIGPAPTPTGAPSAAGPSSSVSVGADVVRSQASVKRASVLVRLSAGWGHLWLGKKDLGEVGSEGTRLELPVGSQRVRVELGNGQVVETTLQVAEQQDRLITIPVD